jgi:hypothetical protein
MLREVINDHEIVQTGGHPKARQRITISMRQQLEAFRKKFGRDPGPEDPVFLDPHSDVPRPVGLADFQAEVVEVMCKADIRPELIHAYIRTGLIVTRDNRKYLSQEDRRAWDRAILEYLERINTEGKLQRKQDEFASPREPISNHPATGPHAHRRGQQSTQKETSHETEPSI